jgi:hypothetical protein
MLEAELMERDRWARDDLLAHQRERVRALVSHAVNQAENCVWSDRCD